MLMAYIRAMLTGTVRFVASGGFTDLFMETCAARGAMLKDVRQQDGALYAQIHEADYPRVCAAATDAGMTLAVTRRSGLPHLLRRYRDRFGIPVGLMAAAIVLTVLSGRVWEVTVAGCEEVGEEEILDVMESLGVAPGAAISRMDTAAVERKAQERLPQLSWIAVNLTGCRVVVEVREITKTPDMTDEREFSNIVAALDGVIVSADVLEGSGRLQTGEAVVKGDLLVSGIIEMNNGFQRFVNAKALIKARTRTELSETIPLRWKAERVVRRRDVIKIRFFGVDLPLGIAIKDGETESAGCYLQSKSTVFPIGLLMKRCVIYELQTFLLPEKEASLLCFAGFCEQAYERYRDAQLLRREITTTVRNGTVCVSAKCECVEEISQRQPFSVEEK